MITQKQLIDTFCSFVRIDSITGHEKEFSDFLCKKISELGYDFFQDERGNIRVSTEGSGVPILLAAHIDTVSPGKNIKPIVRDNGVIQSNGDTILGADNKAMVAVLYEILRLLSTRKFVSCPIDFLFSVSEEAGVSGVDTVALDSLRAKKCITMDVSKPVGTIVLSSPYYSALTITLTGIPADASTAERGVSTLHVLGSFLTSFPLGVHAGDTFCNIGIISGGTASNSLLSHIELRGEIRSFSLQRLHEFEKRIRNLLESITSQSQCAFSFKAVLENHGYCFLSDDVFVKSIQKSLQSVVPRVQLLDQYWGVSDANNLNHRGIQTLCLGYGTKDAHTVRESIAGEDIKRICDFLLHYCAIAKL